MSDPTKELIFRNDVIAQMLAAGWQRGDAANYNRALALYPEDVVGFVHDTQPEQWKKFCALYPTSPEQKFLGHTTAASKFEAVGVISHPSQCVTPSNIK